MTMRTERLPALVALLTAAWLLCAPPARAADCTLVFGQGRNVPRAEGPDWDALNATFNTAVSEALARQGRQTHPSTVPSQQADPRAVGRQLLADADRLGCRTLIETTVFADEQQTLVLRLRVYPLLPQLDAQANLVGLRIGASVFVTQRDLPWTALSRMKPDLLAAQMAAEYLDHDRR